MSSDAPGHGVHKSRRRITPRALLEARSISEPRLHPDGQRVAFVVTESDFEESRCVDHLWITEWLHAPEELQRDGNELAPSPPRDREPGVRHAGHGPAADHAAGEEASEAEDGDQDEDPTRQLTFSHDGEHRPAWSPDGAYLAFLSTRPDETQPPEDDDEDEEPKDQLWILPTDGGEARRLTNAREGVLEYAWAPDGCTLIFMAPSPRPRPIDAVRREARTRRRIDAIVEFEDRRKRQFWRVDTEDAKPNLLFTADFGVLEFDVSPDGKQICYTTNYTGDWNDYHLVDLWIRGLTSGEAWKVVARAGGKYSPRWSPDGGSIAFRSWLDPALSFSRETLFLVDARETGPDGPGVPRVATPDSLDFDVIEHAWSRHDGCLYCLAVVRTGSQIYRINGHATPLLEDAAAERFGLDTDPAGTPIVYVERDAARIGEVVLRDGDGAVWPLTRLNAEFSETYRLPRQEVVDWKSGDGTVIEGVLTYPVDYEDGKRYPLVMQLHGGPKGRSANALMSYGLHPAWAAEGYLILRPNYRGSEGYGNDFAIANRRDLGGGDFEDCMAGVDWCISEGLADPERLGVMGGSYGGFLTNWAIGHTDRFKGAVSLFGIFHLQTDYSNSELSRWENDYLGGYYWEDPEIYRRLSPGTYLENIRTPTLIIHGEEDTNTSLSNSREMFQALRHRGVKTEFVRYPREGHGLREPNHRLDEARRAIGWLDRYVRSGGADPSMYRHGDAAPSASGRLELTVISAARATFLGQHMPPHDAPPDPWAYVEVAFTVSSREPVPQEASVSLRMQDLHLEVAADGAPSATPSIGIALTSPGGKVLIEGSDLFTTQHASEAGEVAFAWSAVFRVETTATSGLLRAADFAPVAIAWSDDEQETERKAPARKAENE